tara:strand:- start:444 stop:641 length:198 start_codon:yes stop_codon:yes gene_type:complete
MNTKPGRPKSTQEDREQKAFDNFIKVIQTMYKHATKSKTGLSKLKLAHKFLTYMVEDIENPKEED